MSISLDYSSIEMLLNLPIIIGIALLVLFFALFIKYLNNKRHKTTPKTKTSKEEINNVSDMIQKETGK